MEGVFAEGPVIHGLGAGGRPPLGTRAKRDGARPRYRVNTVSVEGRNGPSFNASTVLLPLQMVRGMPGRQDRVHARHFRRSGKGTDQRRGGHPARERSGKEYTIQTGQGLARLRVFAAGSRLYQAAVLGSKAQVESADVLTFLNSYSLPTKGTDDSATPITKSGGSGGARPAAGATKIIGGGFGGNEFDDVAPEGRCWSVSKSA